MDKFEKYIENAKKTRVANVPFDKAEARKLLQTRSGTTQNIFRRIFNYFGRHYIMTITSIIALIITGLVVSTPNPEATQDVLKKNNIELLTNENAVKHKALADNQENSGETDPVKKEEANHAVGDTIQEVVDFDIENISWDQVDFHLNSWGFFYIKFKIIYYEKTEKGKKHLVTSHAIDGVDRKYLIRIVQEIEDSVKQYIDPTLLKSMSSLKIEEYFKRLANINTEIRRNYENSKRTIKMINLYTHINRKFMNDPYKEMRIKNKGVLISKDILQKLGITFDKSSFSVPQDEYYPYDKKRKYMMDWMEYKPSTEIPDKDIILNKNIVFEWEKGHPTYDTNGRVNWPRSHARNLKRRKFENIFKVANRVLSGFILKTQTYHKIQNINTNNDYRMVSPYISPDKIEPTYHNALFNLVDDDVANKVFSKGREYFVEKVILEKIKDSITVEEYEQRSEENKINKIIYDNMMTSFKYSKLIPVDIHYPYYGFNVQELKDLPYYEAITLWYYPNEEFLSALPDSIRSQLEKEMKLVNAVQKGELQPEEACAEVGDKESLLGLCNLTEKAISDLSVYPNPAQGMINVSFELMEPRFCKIILSDFNGNYLKEITDWEERKPGTLEYHKDVSGLTPGTYMIQVITEKSEKLMFKFIKE